MRARGRSTLPPLVSTTGSFNICATHDERSGFDPLERERGGEQKGEGGKDVVVVDDGRRMLPVSKFVRLFLRSPVKSLSACVCVFVASS